MKVVFRKTCYTEGEVKDGEKRGGAEFNGEINSHRFYFMSMIITETRDPLGFLLNKHVTFW